MATATIERVNLTGIDRYGSYMREAERLSSRGYSYIAATQNRYAAKEAKTIEERDIASGLACLRFIDTERDLALSLIPAPQMPHVPVHKAQQEAILTCDEFFGPDDVRTLLVKKVIDHSRLDDSCSARVRNESTKAIFYIIDGGKNLVEGDFYGAAESHYNTAVILRRLNENDFAKAFAKLIYSEYMSVNPITMGKILEKGKGIVHPYASYRKAAQTAKEFLDPAAVQVAGLSTFWALISHIDSFTDGMIEHRAKFYKTCDVESKLNEAQEIINQYIPDQDRQGKLTEELRVLASGYWNKLRNADVTNQDSDNRIDLILKVKRQ
jgi:hypothetical protein